MNTKILTLLAFSAVLALPVPASAAADQFLTFSQITGGSVDKRHMGAIEIDDFSWGLSVAASLRSGQTGGGAGKPMFTDFSWTQKGSDISFPTLFRQAASGSFIDSVVLDLVHVGKAPFSYFTMAFTDVILTKLEVAGSSGEVAWVKGSFAYGAVELKVTPQDLDGKPGKPVIGTWNVAANSGNLFSGSALPLMQIANMSAPVQVMAAPVPEPETWAMLLAGLGLVGVAAARRRVA
ncbi:MAG: type VI secretion system tube protein Hcp [Deltaproteobacteria bacterium]|nr:type VI secretion system tube protein Hcp [Deltaproteobacteria bacterium]